MRRRRALGLLIFSLASLLVHQTGTAAPINDHFPGAAVSSLPSSQSYDLRTASAQTDEPNPSCSSDRPNRTLWYSYSSPSAITLAAHGYASTSGGLGIAVYTGSGYKTLTEIACRAFWASADQPTTVTIGTTPGTTYYLQLFPQPYYNTPQGNLELFEALPPSNDDFATRTTLKGFPLGIEAGDNTVASLEVEEPKPTCGGAMNATRTTWFEWIPDFSGRTTLDRIGGHRYGALAVYQGQELATLTEKACASYNTAVSLDVTAGETYLLQSSANGDHAGRVAVNINPQIAGDDRSQALDLALGVTTTAKVFRSTTEPGEPHNCRDGGTVWYKHSGFSGVIKVSTASVAPYSSVAVFRGSTMDRLACALSYNGPQYFEATSDETYYFQLSASSFYVSSSNDSASFSTGELPPPPNDRSSEATQLEGLPVGDSGDNRGARSLGEPVPGCGRNVGATVWYRWKAPSSGRVVIDSFGSSFDTTLAAYRLGSSNDLAEIGCNDDHNGQTSRLVLDVAEEQTYWFQVGGYNGARGDVKINIDTGPLNDDVSEAKAVDTTLFMDATSNDRATFQPSEPRPSCNREETINTLWYRYTPTAGGVVEIDTLGSSFDTVLAVYTGELMQSFNEVACNEDIVLTSSQASAVTFAATSGNDYYIQVGGWKTRYGSSSSGSGKLVLRVTQAGI